MAPKKTTAHLDTESLQRAKAASKVALKEAKAQQKKAVEERKAAEVTKQATRAPTTPIQLADDVTASSRLQGRRVEGMV